MSLLMKALEKAAKDRQEPASPGTPPAMPRVELDLQLQPIEQRPATGSAAPREQARDQVRAATVMRASDTPSGGALSALLARPVLLAGTLAGVFAAAYGTYVYLQLFHPSVFAPSPAPVALKPAPTPPPTPAPAVASPAATLPLLPSAAAVAADASGQRTSGGAAREPAPRDSASPAVPLAAAAPAAAPRETIRVTRGAAGPALNPVLVQAYDALQGNRLADAQRLYEQVAQDEPRNVDALLGLAALAVQRGNTGEAGRLYTRVLEIEPRNALAQAGLMTLIGGADPQGAESRLRQLIDRDPSSPLLYATLGELYAGQRQWAAAQQAFYQAHRLQPENPEHAYNLAVALEHISQPKAALGFYRQALRLAQARGYANFSLPQVQERVSRLEKLVD